MTNYLILLLLNLLVSVNAFSDYIKTDCYGPKNTRVYYAYLHGWDSPNIGQHERLNRRMMKKIAEQNGWRIALVRGRSRCNGGLRQCWNTRSPQDVVNSWNTINAEVQKCFPKKTSYGIVGFSNGGYLVASLFNRCIKGPIKWLVMIGAGQNNRISKVTVPKCCPMRILMGKSDITLKKARAYYQKLKGLGSDVQFITYPGGHIIDQASLVKVINALERNLK